MKINEILYEMSEITYMVNLKDGGGFNVNAKTLAGARSKAKSMMRPGQVIDEIIKDSQTAGFDDKKDHLSKFIKNNRVLQQSPSLQTTLQRKLDAASTNSKLSQVSSEINDAASGTHKKKKHKVKSGS